MGNFHYNDNQCTGSPPLVLGGALGRRSFYLDERGVLRGITYRAPWRDGENVAQCMVTELANPMKMRASNSYGGPPWTCGGVVFEGNPDVPPEPMDGWRWARCEGLGPDCACGFYAYHDGTVRYAISGPGCRVQGIVEAYGRLVLGTLGYRAEKARILAVVAPSRSESSARRHAMERTVADLDDTLRLLEAAGPPRKHIAVAVQGALAAVLAAVGPMTAKGPLLLVAAYSVIDSYLRGRATRESYESVVSTMVSERDNLVNILRDLPTDYREYVERAKARYPSVRWYESEGDMLAAYRVESLAHLARGGESDG